MRKNNNKVPKMKNPMMPRAHSSNNAVAMTPLEPLQVRKPPTRKMKITFPFQKMQKKKKFKNIAQKLTFGKQIFKMKLY